MPPGMTGSVTLGAPPVMNRRVPMSNTASDGPMYCLQSGMPNGTSDRPAGTCTRLSATTPICVDGGVVAADDVVGVGAEHRARAEHELGRRVVDRLRQEAGEHRRRDVDLVVEGAVALGQLEDEGHRAAAVAGGGRVIAVLDVVGRFEEHDLERVGDAWCSRSG